MGRLVRSSCDGEAGCQAGEASLAVMCWGGGMPGRQGRQAGKAARQASRSGRHVHELGGGGGGGRVGGGMPVRRGRQAIMCIVRISCHSSQPHFFPLLLEECDITGALGHTPSPNPVG